jgi:protein O-mannosyl-transferase
LQESDPTKWRRFGETLHIRDGISRILSIAAILFVTFLVFWPAIRYALVYDDFEQIVTNPRLTSWSYIPGYFTTHLWAHSPLQPANYYRPVFLIWLRLVDTTLGPPSAIWHLTSILAHLAATLSVFMLIRRLIGNFKGAALAAGLFAIHPIHTEAVAWVSSVTDPLLTIFLVLSVYYYARRKGPISFVSLLFAALAMFTKEAGIVAPALILAYEWTNSRFKDAMTAAAPYLLPAFLYSALRMNALGNFTTGVPPNMSVGAMVLTWPRVLAVYAAHLVWPVHLSVCYDVAVGTAVWPLLLLMIVIAGLASALRGCSANLRFGAAWFVITLMPCLGLRYLFTGDYVHDRYLYLPSVGLAVIAGVGFSRIVFTLPRAVAGSALALALCWGTRSDLRIWQDDVSLFRRAVETAPLNPYAKNNLADAYLKSHREAEALPLLEQVIALNPGYRLGYYNMARYYEQIGNSEEAERYFSISDQIYYSQQAGTGVR